MFIFFVVAARLFSVFASILRLCCWSAHKSLAPRIRTLLGVLRHATLNFLAVATLLFFFFCVCPKFCDLAKQRRKIFVGVSEVGKMDFALYFFWLCVFFLVFHFLLLRSRDGLIKWSTYVESKVIGVESLCLEGLVDYSIQAGDIVIYLGSFQGTFACFFANFAVFCPS